MTAAPRNPGLETLYRQAGFGATLGFGRRPALVVVDAVRAYLDPACPLYAGVEDAVASMARVLAAARRVSAPVVFTRVGYQADATCGGVFFRKVPALQIFSGDNPVGQIVDELTPKPGEYVLTKEYPSAFFGTPLASYLTAAGVDTCIVVGLTTSGCVRATVVDAMQHGFVPVVVREAVGDRAAGPHEANLFDLEAKYADVLSEVAVLEALRL